MKKVVVIGAGITGCYTAYFLAKAGCSVVVIDREGVGSQATSTNPGGLNPLHGPGIPGVLSDLALRSYALHASLQDELEQVSGIDFHGRTVTRLEVAVTEDEERAMAASRDLYNATAGFSADWMHSQQLQQEEPRLSSSVRKGLLMHGNRMVHSSAYAKAVLAAAEKLGVEMHHAEATGLKKSAGNVTHVTTDQGDLECDAVVIATGAWYQEASEWLGMNIPVRPLKGQMMRAKLHGRKLPFHITRGLIGIYEVQDGTLWLGGTMEDCGFDTELTSAGRDLILNGIEEIFPAIGDAEILEHLTGFRPATPDKLPVVGPVPDCGNAFIAGGSGPKGMLLSSGLAEAVSTYILEREPDFEISQFLPARFF